MSKENGKIEVVPSLIKSHGEKIGDVKFSTNVAGTTFVPDSDKILRYLKDKVSREDIILKFIREPENPYDENAVRVEVTVKNSTKQYKIGYVPKDRAPLISYALNHEDMYKVIWGGINLFGGEGGKENIGLFFEYQVLDITRRVEDSSGKVEDSLGKVEDISSMDLSNFFNMD